MIKKSLFLIVLVTFANFVSPGTHRRFRQRVPQAPRYGNIPAFQPIYDSQKSLHPESCKPKQFTTVASDTFAYIQEAGKVDEHLILPPRSIQLPFGLGYGYAAIPTVAEAYREKFFDSELGLAISEALIPVSPEFANIKIATPFCNEWEFLDKSIVL